MSDLQEIVSSQNLKLRRSESSLVRQAAMTASTLVETVSINYEDFTEGFLTCSTCLCTYDNADRSPKLLHCSHTVCLSCLEKISSLPGVRESGSFRCPICRETIPLPRGGVITLPPSFLVNQLLDLMARQRREIIPKCSIHANQELLFCETCDVVFCNKCTEGQHVNEKSNISRNGVLSSPEKNSEHTVITFSIAIKRMSEILLYKGHQCVNKLSEAQEAVQMEMRKLDMNSATAFEDINRTFQELMNLVDRRRQELLSCAKKVREDKMSVLENQLRIICAEKDKVQSEIDTLQYQVESQVENITKKINDLGEKMDSVSKLVEPRENCFIRYEHSQELVETISTSLNEFGSIRTSRTFPSLCTANIVGKCYAHLQATVIISTFDASGCPQRFGGDPVVADLRCDSHELPVTVKVNDLRDGNYEAQFVPPRTGSYTLRIAIFGRPIKTFPIQFEASDNINPLCIYGAKGSDLHQFNQPVGLAIDLKTSQIFILDTGNARIKVLSQNNGTNNAPFSVVTHIENIKGLEKSSTGIALSTEDSLYVSNWRTKEITEMTHGGEWIRYFSHQDLVEPTYLAVNTKGEILVADNGAKSIFIFHPCGKLRLQIKSALTGNSSAKTQRQSIGSNVILTVPKSATLPASAYNPIKPAVLNLVAIPTSDTVNFQQQDKRPSFGVIGALCVGPNDDIIIADSVIQVLAPFSGNLIREIYPEGRNKGSFGGICFDFKGHLVATRVEKTKSFVQVFDYSSGQLKFVINSFEARLRRPASLATTSDHQAIVVDLGNDCIKTYRYI